MKQKNFVYGGAMLLCMVLSTLSGCTQVPSSIGTQSNVGMVSDGERAHIQDKLTAEDFIALAGKVTEKMLSSRETRTWKKRPLIVVSVPENTTHDPNIIPEDLQDEIISKILDSGIARVIDESSVASGFKYIIKTTITSTVQRGDNGSRLTYYICKLELSSLRGERLGQWHDKIGLIKTPRSFF